MSQQFAALGAVATLAGCLLAGKAAAGPTTPSRARFVIIFLLALCLLILPVELGSMLYYVLSAFHTGIDIGRSWELMEMQFWYTTFPLIPFLYAAFLFSWIWAPLLTKILWKPEPVAVSNTTGKPAGLTGRRVWLVVAGCFVLSAAFLGYYPYFRNPAIN